jgi:uncharacterized phage protein (TIGR01671 family)
MRVIKFRGKDLDTNEWVYGDLLRAIDYDPDTRKGVFTKGYIIHEKGDENTNYVCRSVDIDPNTVGQFTGFFDTNGQPIFEGDILKSHIKKFEHIPYIVGYRLGLFETRPNNQDLASMPLKYLLNDNDEGSTLKSWTVIGNIYDNPELLKGGAQ